MGKKITIVTLYDSINCGTFLQAYSLGEFLKENGYEPLYLKLKNDNSTINLKIKNKMKLKEIIIKIIRKIKLKKKFKNIGSYFKTIDLEELNANENIKNVIIGSDEIWNVNNDSFIHYKEFFGYNFKNKNVIAYAPSCNDINKTNIKKYDKKLNFNNFNFLSSRDEKTYNLLKEYKMEKVTNVLDPTFLTDSYKNNLEDIKLKNYIVVYGHSFNDDQIQTIKKIAKEKNKKLISITKYYDWCDENFIATPFEFLSYIKNADYIITSTFHGSVFSIIFEKNFIAFVEKENKVSDLLRKFGLESRIFENANEGLDLLNKSIDYKKINNIKKEMKKESVEYLLNSIK